MLSLGWHAAAAATSPRGALRWRQRGVSWPRKGAGGVMIVGRVIGWIALLFGAAVLVRDVLVWFDIKHWAPLALGQLWYDLNRSSLNFVQAVVQRYIHPFLWDPVIVSVLLFWAFAVLMAVGAVLLI